MNVPPSIEVIPGGVSCFLNLEAYWNPPFLSLIFHPVAEDPPLVLPFLLQLVKPIVSANTTNNFNLNLFLNEKCKDALNISDFIESLKITLEDLDFSNKNGMVQGISNLMIKGLKELNINKRPIHCTDAKRDIIYIKDKRIF